MAGIRSYNSPVEVGIGRTPRTQDPVLFGEMVDVYNAIHSLLANLDKVSAIIGGGNAGSSDPLESMPFIRFYAHTALQPIVLGDLICPASINNDNGVVKGALLSSTLFGSPRLSRFAGIALTSANVGELVRVGVGPAAVEVPGILCGQTVWGYGSVSSAGATYKGDGALYNSNPGDVVIGGQTYIAVPVGISVKDGYAVIGQHTSINIPGV